MKTIKAKVHRLPSEVGVISECIKPYTEERSWNIGELMPYDDGHVDYWATQHLYITTDEEIKEGDWFYYNHNGGVIGQYKKGMGEIDGKIIATTDLKLIADGVAEIEQSFIEEYCKAGGIDEVLVSVDSYLNIPVGTSVKFNDWLPSTLKEYEGLKGQVIWGVEDRLDAGNHCIKVEFLNKYNNNCKLYASVSHWYESIKHLYYHKIAIDSNNTIIIHPVETDFKLNRNKLLKLVHDVGGALTKEDSTGFDLDKWIEENL